MQELDEKRFLTHLNSSLSCADTVKKHVNIAQKSCGSIDYVSHLFMLVANIPKQAPLYLCFWGTTVMNRAFSPCLLPTLPAIWTSFHLECGNPEKNLQSQPRYIYSTNRGSLQCIAAEYSPPWQKRRWRIGRHQNCTKGLKKIENFSSTDSEDFKYAHWPQSI